jgi:hypothetical protein
METFVRPAALRGDMPALAQPLEHQHDSALPMALKLILFTLFLPEAMSFFVADLRLTFTRAIFIILTPAVFIAACKNISSSNYRFVASDLFVVLTALWMFVGPSVTYNLSDTLVHSGPVVLEYLIAYMSTRFLLSGSQQCVAFAGLLCFVLSFVALDAVLDVATGRYFTRELAQELTGYAKEWRVADEVRFGLLRAAGPLEHPILFGFVSALGLLLAVAVDIRRRGFCIAACALGVVISLSSAPQQSAIIGLGLLAYSRIFASMPHKWLVFSIVPTIAIVSLFALTPTPFGHLFDFFTIDSQTAYFRLYVWNEVGPAILDNPYFAVPDTDYDYQGSIDSVWLVLSLQYGMVCSILTALSMIGACSLPTDRARAGLTGSESRLGAILGIIIFLIIYTGFTVHFWGSTWITVGLLVGLRARLGELGRLNRTAAQ